MYSAALRVALPRATLRATGLAPPPRSPGSATACAGAAAASSARALSGSSASASGRATAWTAAAGRTGGGGTATPTRAGRAPARGPSRGARHSAFPGRHPTAGNAWDGPGSWFTRSQPAWPKTDARSMPIGGVLGSGFSARLIMLAALNTTSGVWTPAGDAVARLLAGRRPWTELVPVSEAERRRELEAAERAEKAARPPSGALGRLRALLADLTRLATLCLLFTPVLATCPAAWSGGWARRQWQRLLRRTLELAGPAFIKWGQWAATRRDLFPADLCASLERLHSHAPAHRAAASREIVRQAFGGFSVEDLFDGWHEEPIASGSIGQIHEARLSETAARLTRLPRGTRVAVKVRHPGVGTAVERDFALMLLAARLLDRLPLLAHLRLEESLAQFSAPLREQVDLAREALNLHEFSRNFRTVRNVSFPTPCLPLATPAVLVETFEPGDHISEYVSRGAGAPFNSSLASIGARTMLRMMIVDSLVHADLHPGNILVHLEPVGGKAVGRVTEAVRRGFRRLGSLLHTGGLEPPPEWMRRPRLVLLDAGMTTRLTPEDTRAMCGLFDAFSRLDGRGVARWILEFSGASQTCPDPEAFARAVQANFAAAEEKGRFGSGVEANGAEELASVLDACRTHRVSLPGHICATVVTTLVLEGWSHNLDPAHSTLAEVHRILAAARGGIVGYLGTVADAEILHRVPSFDDPITPPRWDAAKLVTKKV